MNRYHLSDKIKVRKNGFVQLAINSYDNYLNIINHDFILEWLDVEQEGSKGGNSNVFILKNPEDDEGNSSLELIIKICKFSINKHHAKKAKVRKKRFWREIGALIRAKKNKLDGIINYVHHGVIQISEYEFPFYIMEKATCDLTDHLHKGQYDITQKLLLCRDIVYSFIDLRNIDLYHRDIKHDNMLICDGKCKIGDLGLIKYKYEDNIDYKNERIGAFGWESPEVMNKVLIEDLEEPEFNFDMEIDHQSDIFQLGKLFWFIFQGNLPIGQLTIDDFLLKEESIYELIYKMLSYNKSQRPDIFQLKDELNPIWKLHNVS